MTEKYITNLLPSMFVWNETLQKYVVTISADTMGFDASQYITVIKVLRKENATAPWKNIIVAYDIDTSGNLILYFDVVFTARLNVIKDS